MTNETTWGDAPLLAAMPFILQRANAEIAGVLRALRDCRTQLEAATHDRLDVTRAKLREVTSATELATTDILDGLDRASGLIDRLDSAAAPAEEGPALRDRLRDELFTVTGHLQFQDITSQQLSHASSVLVEMESRLAGVVGLISASGSGQPAPAPASEASPEAPVTHATDASYSDAAGRQSVADSIFGAHPDARWPEPARAAVPSSAVRRG